MVARVGRLQDHDAILAVETLLYRIKSRLRLAGLHTDAREHAEALRFDVDLALLTLVGADLVAEGVIGADKPFAVPAGREKRLRHGFDLRARICRLFLFSDEITDIRIFIAVLDEHAADKD